MLSDLMISIEERYRVLSNELNAANRKLYCQRLFIDRLEKTWTERAMDPDGSRNDGIRDL